MFGLICRQKEWDKSNCKLKKFPSSLFNNSIRRHLDERNPFCSCIVYSDAALTLCLLTLRQELMNCLNFSLYFLTPPTLFVFSFSFEYIRNQKADLTCPLPRGTHTPNQVPPDNSFTRWWKGWFVWGFIFVLVLFVFGQQWLRNCSKCCTRVQQTQELGHR